MPMGVGIFAKQLNNRGHRGGSCCLILTTLEDAEPGGVPEVSLVYQDQPAAAHDTQGRRREVTWD